MIYLSVRRHFIILLKYAANDITNSKQINRKADVKKYKKTIATKFYINSFGLEMWTVVIID